MFFIMGISQGQKKLNFDQLVVCPQCGRYGHLEGTHRRCISCGFETMEEYQFCPKCGSRL